jgi:hypothetical protein
MTPLEFFTSVTRDPDQPLSTRLKRSATGAALCLSTSLRLRVTHMDDIRASIGLLGSPADAPSDSRGWPPAALRTVTLPDCHHAIRRVLATDFDSLWRPGSARSRARVAGKGVRFCGRRWRAPWGPVRIFGPANTLQTSERRLRTR